MPKISEIVTSLLELQGIIGDQEVVLVREQDAEIPLPDIPEYGVNLNGHEYR